MNSAPLQIDFVPVTSLNKATYIEIGIRSYEEHYLHLWPNSDPSPYISNNYTIGIVSRELQNEQFEHYLVELDSRAVGLFKLVLNAALGDYGSGDALLVEKIYLLANYSGMGLGRAAINFIIQKARNMGKKIIWLDTMKNGPALNFYLNFGFEIVGKTELSYPSALDGQKAMLILQYNL